MSRRTLFTLLCLALTAWFLARTTFLLRDPAPEQVAASRRARNTGSTPEPLGTFESIGARNLLGVSVAPPENARATAHTGNEEAERLSEGGAEALPVSKRGWKLLGTIVDTGAGQSRAIIQIDGNDLPYREGETLQGWTIAQVLRRTVIVAKGNTRERLIMNDDAPRTNEAKPDEQRNVSRAQLREQLGDIGALMRSVTVAPQTLGGYQGLRIASIAPGSYMEKLGLRKDDLLLGANGKPLRGFGDLAELGGLADQNAITLDILRNGKKTIIRYDVQS